MERLDKSLLDARENIRQNHSFLATHDLEQQQISSSSKLTSMCNTAEDHQHLKQISNFSEEVGHENSPIRSFR